MLATYPPKRQTELFFLQYTVVWNLVLGLVFATRLYASFSGTEYVVLSVALALPCVLGPLALGFQTDVPFLERYWVKAIVFLSVMVFVANYFCRLHHRHSQHNRASN